MDCLALILSSYNAFCKLHAININLKEITEIVCVLIKGLEFDKKIRIFVFFSEKNRKFIWGINKF